MPESVIDEYSLETANGVGDTAIYEPSAPSVDTQNCRSVGSRSIGLDELRVATSPRGKAEYAPLDVPGPSKTLSDAKILIAGSNTLHRRSRSMSRSNPLL